MRVLFASLLVLTIATAVFASPLGELLAGTLHLPQAAVKKIIGGDTAPLVGVENVNVDVVAKDLLEAVAPIAAASAGSQAAKSDVDTKASKTGGSVLGGGLL